MINSTGSDVDTDEMYSANPRANSDSVAALCFVTPAGHASPTDFATSGNSPEDSASAPGGRASLRPTDLATAVAAVVALCFAAPRGRGSTTDFFFWTVR